MYLTCEQARQTQCLAHSLGGLHLCSATPTPLPETTSCRQLGCPQGCLNRASEKLCPGGTQRKWGPTQSGRVVAVSAARGYASACNSAARECPHGVGLGGVAREATGRTAAQPLKHSTAGKLSPCWLPDWLPGAAHRTRTRLFGSRGHHGKARHAWCEQSMHSHADIEQP
jgi:hypothetical protein